MGFSIAAARALDRQFVAERPRSFAIVTIIERLIALILSIAFLPVLIVVAVLVAVLSGRSPLIALARAGHRGKRIWLIKVRTMWCGEKTARNSGRIIERIENAAVPELKTEFDPRVTSSFAAFCRRYSIDELPQLWHVVRGEMALVGPRPLTHQELDTYYGYDADEVVSVRPGLTGLWQVRGRNALTYRRRLALDLYLVRHWSIRLYLFVLAATVPTVFSGRNAG